MGYGVAWHGMAWHGILLIEVTTTVYTAQRSAACWASNTNTLRRSTYDFPLYPQLPLFTFTFTIHPVRVFYASMTSGLIYSVITMPLETAKNRMAFQKPDAVTGTLL